MCTRIRKVTCPAGLSGWRVAPAMRRLEQISPGGESPPLVIESWRERAGISEFLACSEDFLAQPLASFAPGVPRGHRYLLRPVCVVRRPGRLAAVEVSPHTVAGGFRNLLFADDGRIRIGGVSALAAHPVIRLRFCRRNRAPLWFAFRSLNRITGLHLRIPCHG